MFHSVSDLLICTAILVLGVMVVQNQADGQNGPEKNICPNPSFEMLSPVGNNFPLGWSAGNIVEGKANVTIDNDTREGGVSIRLSAKGDGRPMMNSDLIDARSATVRFHYKAISSQVEGRNLKLYVIAMSPAMKELSRVEYTVPKEHVGDGQWHQGSLEVQFLQAECTGMLICPRINENSDQGDGEWIIDDVECIARKYGPRPVIEALYMPQPIMRPGKPVELIVQIANGGDDDIAGGKLRLQLPDGLEAVGKQPAEIVIDKLTPGDWKRFVWQIRTERCGEYDIKVDLEAGEGRSISRSRHTVCVSKIDERELYTGPDGFWRAMPKLDTMQQGNRLPLKRVKPKKSSELADSYFGIAGHLPRSEDMERIFEPECLIDSNYGTNWSGRAHATSVPGSVDWVEITFPKSHSLKQVNLVPYWNAEGFPIDFVIKARKANRWSVVHEARRVGIGTEDGQGKKKPYVIQLPDGTEGDAIRLEVTRFNMASGFFCDLGPSNYVRLSEIEAIDEFGVDVALALRGGKVTASSTQRAYYNSAQVIRETYHEFFDLGIKWIRVGQWGDRTCWAAVEPKKGQYYIDPEMDRAITQTAKDGVHILYTLAYGNSLYEKTEWLTDPGPVWRHGHPFTGDGGPTKPESIQGFVNYAKFVATHFKGRIKHYEIWNEENSWAWYGSPPDPKAFGTLIKETARALKEIDPENEVMVGGTAAPAPTFITDTLTVSGPENIDAIAFHPYGAAYPEGPAGSLDVVDGKQHHGSPAELGYSNFEEFIAYYRKLFARFNPNFQMWQNEWNGCPAREDDVYSPPTSEIQEAKQMSRFFVTGLLHEVYSVWWSLVNENYISDWGVLREADRSRKPCYFTTQAVTTFLSGAKLDSSFGIEVTPTLPDLLCKALKGANGEKLAVVYVASPPTDDCTGKPVSLRIGIPGVRSVEAVDTLHALVQKLSFREDSGGIVIDGLLVTDCPIVLTIK